MSVLIFVFFISNQAGKFLLEIRSVADPNIYVSSPEPIIVCE